MNNAPSRHRHKAILISALVFIVLLALPALLLDIYFSTQTSLTAQEVAREETLADLASSALQIRLNALVRIAMSMASSPEIVSAAADGKWSDAADAARDLQNDVQYYDPFIDRVIIFDASATQQAAYPALTGGLGTNASGSAWYAALSSGGQTFYVSNATKRATIPQIQVINIAVPINASSGIAGFLVLQVPTDNFLEFGQSLALGTYGFAYVVDPAGNVIASPKVFSDSGSVVNYSSVPEVAAVMQGENGVEITPDHGGNEGSLIVYKPVATYGWGVVVQSLYDEVFSAMINILFEIEIFILMTVIADILISYLLFRFLSTKHHA